MKDHQKPKTKPIFDYLLLGLFSHPFFLVHFCAHPKIYVNATHTYIFCIFSYHHKFNFTVLFLLAKHPFVPLTFAVIFSYAPNVSFVSVVPPMWNVSFNYAPNSEQKIDTQVKFGA